MVPRFLGATVCALALVLSVASCDKNPLIDVNALQQPRTTSNSPSPDSPYGPATTIALGESSTERVQATDKGCQELGLGGDYYASGVPCERYLVTVPAAGALTVQVQWGNADNMLLLAGRVAPYGKLAASQCCSSPLGQTYQVTKAGAFLIFVVWTGNRSGSNLAGSNSQTFTVTPTFSPVANAQPVPAK